MQVYKNWLKDVHLSLQIPNCYIGFKESDFIEVPDSWFLSIKFTSSGLPCPTIGRESGYTFLSREGWEANREALFELWKGEEQRLDESANKFFANVNRAIENRISKAKKDLAQLEALKKQ